MTENCSKKVKKKLTGAGTSAKLFPHTVRHNTTQHKNMKKTLLIAVAALAAGIISSQAQAVYSQNIVGYVNQPIKGSGAFNLIVNPLQGTNTNPEQTMACLTQGDIIYIFGNGQYYLYNYYPGAGHYNWIDAGSGNIPVDPLNNDGTVPPPSISPGQSFFYVTGVDVTNVWTGTVITSNTVPVVGGGVYNFVASSLPIGGSIELTNLNLPLTQGDILYIYKNNQYYLYNYYPGAGYYNWIDAGSGNIPVDPLNNDGSVPPPQLTVGQGFIYTAGSTTNWTQKLNIQ